MDSIQEQIIQAAQQLFQQYGLQKVTMDDVAREIGKRRSSLYYYYRNKEEILDAAIDVEMREILAEIVQAVEQAAGFEQRLTAYCMTRLKISQKRREFYNVVDSGMNAGEMSDYMKVKNVMHDRFRQMEIPVVKQILQYGIEKRQIRQLDSKEQDTLVTVLVSSLQGFKKEMVVRKRYSAIEPAVAMLVSMIIQGFKK
jgi:AcrR family transcriptional regulator